MDSTSSSSIAGVGEDSLVITPSGVEQISNIRPGREVLTDNNEFTKVTEVHSTGTQKQTAYKISIPLLSDAFEKTVYVTESVLFYGLPKKSDLAAEIAATQLSDDSLVFVPNKVKQFKQVLSYQLRGQDVVSDKEGVFVPVTRITKTEISMNLVSLQTEAGQFVANGITVYTEENTS